MRVTFILPHAGISGGTRVVAIYARKLINRGHDVRVVSVPLRPLRWKQRVRQWLRGAPDRPSRATFFDDMPGVLHVIDRSRPVENRDVPDADVVLATWWETAEWAWNLSPQKGAKAYFVQGHEVFPYLPRERVEATLRLPMHKITVAGWLRGKMAELYDDHTVSLVENSVDTEQFDAPARGKQPRPTLGLLYSSAVIKGFADARDVIARLRRRVPELRVVSFGSEAPAATVPLAPGTEYFRAPPQDRLREIYAGLDVWLCPSHTEGFHLPPLEAMACRTPVVSTRVGGAMEAVEVGRNGYLADIGDIGALSEHTLRVLTLDDAAWRAMSTAAYERARRYSWDDATVLLERALETAVERSARGEVAGGARAATQ
ncbi:MAG: glycosyltransferase family 4 protein [Phycisphaerales bacterium]|nr:glycosyltransferase family 4 protein [Phycisphaerales bacterium]